MFALRWEKLLKCSGQMRKFPREIGFSTQFGLDFPVACYLQREKMCLQEKERAGPLATS